METTRQLADPAALAAYLADRLPEDLRARQWAAYDAGKAAVEAGELTQEQFAKQLVDLTADLQGLAARRAKERVDELWRQELAERQVIELDYATADSVWKSHPDPDPIIEHLLPSQGSLLVNAQRKAGKTTLALNLIESLTTGKPFLGRLATKCVGKVAYLNYEMSKGLFTQYSENLLTKPEDAIVVTMNASGNLLASEKGRALLAEKFLNDDVRVLIVDPLSSAFSGVSLNDNDETRSWLDELLVWCLGTCKMDGLIVVHHSGWNGERSRGASAIEDWAMVVAGLRTNEGQQDGPRYFDAFGRLGVLPQDELSFDPSTGALTLTGHGGKRAANKASRVASLVTPATEWFRAQTEPATQRQMVAALRAEGYSLSNDIQRELIKALRDSGTIEPEGKGYRFALADEVIVP